MPKRFTVTEKWNDEWFMSLSPQAKVIWEYLRDNCDLCGVWEVNIELMRFRIRFSEQVDVLKHLNELNEVAKKLKMEPRVEWFADRRRLWIKNFIKVQYGVLSEKSSTHRGVIRVIENHRLSKGLPKSFELLLGRIKNKATLRLISSNLTTVQEAQLIENAEDFLLKNPKDLERIRNSVGKTAEETARSLRKFHLHLIKKDAYPVNYNWAAASFEMWLMNERGNDSVSIDQKQTVNTYLEQRKKDEQRLKEKLG